jgi:hypothetical protein
MEQLVHLVRTLLIYAANGLLLLAYVAWEHVSLLLTAGACLWLLNRAPAIQRPWIAGVSALTAMAAVWAPAPVPFLLTGMILAGAMAVQLDHFSPDSLRWRITGAMALYAGAALAYQAYSHYLAGVDAAAWAEAIGGQDEAQAALAQGRAFLNTLATWGLWLILPLGYLSLLAQGLLVHPPVPGQPHETIAAVRTRGRNDGAR